MIEKKTSLGTTQNFRVPGSNPHFGLIEKLQTQLHEKDELIK